MDSNSFTSIFPMRISNAGLNIIRQFEGYVRELPNGDCEAYRCLVGHRPDGSPIYDGKWTIGWGCTNGIKEGMVWTRAQAEAGLRREIEKSEQEVTRVCTVTLNQNQFDALVSLDYNIGDGGLEKSTVLRRLNGGDYAGAAHAFSMWNKSGGVVVPGLVSRRGKEAALFLTPVRTEAADQPAPLMMPQKVDEPTSPAPPAATEATVGVGGLGGLAAAAPGIMERSTIGGKWNSWAFLAAVLSEPLFWVAATALIGSLIFYLHRRKLANG